MPKKEVLNSLNPYKVTEDSTSYSFRTSCNLNYKLGFVEESDFMGYECDFKLLSLYFLVDKPEKAKDPDRIASTLCNIINSRLANNKDIVIWYICSTKAFQKGKPEDAKYSAIRQRIFKQWFHKYKERFPDIQFFTIDSKQAGVITDGIDPFYTGFLHQKKFKFAGELREMVESVSGNELISSDKESSIEEQ